MFNSSFPLGLIIFGNKWSRVEYFANSSSFLSGQTEASADKLKDLEKLLSGVDGGLKPASETEAALKAAEETVTDLQDDVEDLTGLL